MEFETSHINGYIRIRVKFDPLAVKTIFLFFSCTDSELTLGVNQVHFYLYSPVSQGALKSVQQHHIFYLQTLNSDKNKLPPKKPKHSPSPPDINCSEPTSKPVSGEYLLHKRKKFSGIFLYSKTGMCRHWRQMFSSMAA